VPRSRRALIAVAVSALLAAGCASSGFDADSLRDDLVDTGMSPDEATCVVEGMQDHFSPQQLGAHVDANDEQRAAQRRIMAECEVSPRSP
jgi:hypothetical protein